MTAAHVATTGYRLVLPPGWVGLPSSGDACVAAVRHIVDRAMSRVDTGVPPDTVATLRRTLEGRLRKAADDAREAGANDLYLPVDRIAGVLMPASFVVAETTVDTDGVDPADAIAVLARLIARADGATAVEVDGVVGVRVVRDTTAPDEADLGVRAGSRHVDYVLSPPGRPGRWLGISYSVLLLPGDEELVEVLVELFDAVMTTWRWQAS